MALLRVEGIRKHFGPEPVLDGVRFELRTGDRVGLVGPNGCGKTTLLRILAGSIEPDGGSIERASAITVSYLEQRPQFDPQQTVWAEAQTALEPLLALQREATELAGALAAAGDPTEQKRLAARYDTVQHELERRDAFHVDHRIERVLEGLGFAAERFAQPVGSLSGGEQNRLLLAKLLLADPDVMLLDEPSNHLDLDATAWLEEHLAGCRAAMIVVSHDRYFLDKVTNRTLELFRGTVDDYRGNFSSYVQQKEQRLLVARRTYEKQQEEIRKAEEFIRRHAAGQKHAQAEDRRKKLARIQRVEPPREIPLPPMYFPAAPRSGDVVLRVERLAKSFDRLLFAELSFDVLRGQRWAILGPNGSGKTTMLRCLLGKQQPDAGRVTIGHGVRVAYFDQHLADFDDRLTAVDAVRPGGALLEEQQRRDLLARFGLEGDRALLPVGELSGGQRCRLALAQLALSEANLLVLDEPTNHLDLWAREALQQALQRFGGTVLLVSHDRYLVDRVADHVVAIEAGGRVRVVDGNYTTYRQMLACSSDASRPAPSEPPAAEQPEASSQPAPNANKPVRRRRKFPYRKLADLEAEILQQEEEIERVQALLINPEVLRQGQRIRELRAQLAELQAGLRQLYEHWEEAVELDG